MNGKATGPHTQLWDAGGRQLAAGKQARWKILAGIAILCIAAWFALFFFGELATPKFKSVVLFPTPEYEADWTYYDETGNALHETYDEDGYLDGVEGFEGNAVAAERIMGEELPNTVLKFEYMGQQISVYLDGRLLYSDIAGTPEEGIDFLPPDAEAFEREQDVFKTRYVALPDDYIGSTLTVVTYFPDGFNPVPVYPTLQNDDTIAAQPVADSAKYIALAGAFAAVAFLLLAILVYGLASGTSDWPVALLAAFFLCAMVTQAYDSQTAYYSIGTSLAGYLVPALYIDLLFLFFACYMRKGFRVTIICAVVLHVTETIVQAMMVASKEGFYEMWNNGWVAFGILMLFIVLCCLEWKAGKSYFPVIGKCLLAFGVAYAALILFSRLIAPESAFATEIWMPLSSLFFGRAVAVNGILSDYLAIVGMAVILIAFIRRNISIATERNTLALRNEMMLENMQGMETYLRTSGEQRHEMKHHVAALQILLKSGEERKAEEYLKELAEEVDASGKLYETENILVNAILNDEAAKAEGNGIDFKTDIAIPRELSISDNDLCSLLYNMLDNSMRACREMPPGQKRWIYLKIQKKGNFLVVLCRNSKDKDIVTNEEGNIGTSKKNRVGHGYGLSIMREICEKYHSVLLVEFDEDSFTVKTNLRLPD